MNNRIRRELDRLLSTLVDGEPDGRQQLRLGELLDLYPEARDYYLAYFDVHMELSRTGAFQTSVCEPALTLPPQAPASRTAPFWRLLTGSAAVLAIAVSVWLAVGPKPGPSAPAVACLVSAECAQWAGEPADRRAGDDLASGQLHLETGLARIRMRSGVELVLKAPAMVELIDMATVRLNQGNLTVSVTDESVSFRVLTPTAYLVDLGTEFGVEVEEGGTTEVHVFQGVVVAKSSASGSVIPIAAREAARIDAPRDRHDLMHGEIFPVTLAPSRFSGLSAPADDAAAKPASHEGVRNRLPLNPGARIVFLGDHATSRETHLLLAGQALHDLSPKTNLKFFNAAWAFPLSFQEDHYREHVLSYAPTHAVIEFGPEIAGSSHPCTPGEFRDAMTRLVDRLEQSGIEPVIATGFAIPRDDPRATALLEQFNRDLRELALQRGYRLADVDAGFRCRPDAEPGLVHTFFAPTFDGYRVMAAALLESFGFPDAVVPQSLDVSMMPGVVTHWKFRVRPKTDRLNPDTVAGLAVDETWTRLDLPQHDQFSRRMAQPGRSLVYHDRARGFATHLTDAGSKIVHATADIECVTNREVFFNPGARVMTIWLNGVKIYDCANPWAGWQPGKERIPAQLKAGRNQIVIETQDAFFLSITNRRDWALPRPSTRH